MEILERRALTQAQLTAAEVGGIREISNGRAFAVFFEAWAGVGLHEETSMAVRVEALRAFIKLLQTRLDIG